MSDFADSIQCWEDAGNWSCAAALACGSMEKRLEAVRKAIRERMILLDLEMDDSIRPDPMTPPGAAIQYYSNCIARLAEHFAAAEDGVFEEITLTSFGESRVFTEQSLDALTCRVSASTDVLERTAEWTAANGVLQCSILQTGRPEILLRAPASATFKTYRKFDFIDRFPGVGQSVAPASLLRWLWDAYSALKRLTRPILSLTMAFNACENTSSQTRAVRVFLDAENRYGYAAANGSCVFSGLNSSESQIWDSIEWTPDSDPYAFGSAGRLVSTADFPSQTSGTPEELIFPVTEIELYRRKYTSVCRNASSATLVGALPLRLIYRKRCHREAAWHDFLSSEGFTENEWLPVFDGTLAGNAAFDTQDGFSSACPTGTGSINDASHSFQGTLTCNFNDTFGLRFV